MELPPSTNLWSSSIQSSRGRGEWVNLSMESKDGKDSVTFSFGKTDGDPVGPLRTCTSGSPWAWTPQPWNTRTKRRKTPSQWRRDQKRRQELLAKKKPYVKEENVKDIPEKVSVANATDLEDEI